MSHSFTAAINQYAITDTQLRINSDSYDINKIYRAEVRELVWRDHLIKMVLSGLVFASILFVMMPADLPFAKSLPLLAFAIGAFAALSTCSKYELRVEFMHSDETGLQWIAVDSGRNSEDYGRFKDMVREINQKVN